MIFEKMLQRIKPDDKLLALYKEVLIAETANQLGSLNSKISRARSQLDTIAENRLNAIKKFNADLLTVFHLDTPLVFSEIRFLHQEHP